MKTLKMYFVSIAMIAIVTAFLGCEKEEEVGSLKCIECNKCEIDTSGAYTYGRVYQADTDGFVVAQIRCVTEYVSIRGYTDSSSNPSTLIASAHATDSNEYGDWGDFASFTMPVRKGDYWRVGYSIMQTPATITVYWIPFN